MPTVVAKSKPVSKTFQIKNTGIKGVTIDWRIFDMMPKVQSAAIAIEGANNLEKEENDYFNIDIIKNMAFDKAENPYKFEF